MTASTSTPSTTRTPSTPSPSHPTGTGSVLPQGPVSRSGTWRARTWWRSSDQRCQDQLVLSHHSVCHWHGLLMVRHSLLATAIAWSGCGRCHKLDLAKSFCLVFQTPVKRRISVSSRPAARDSGVFLCGNLVYLVLEPQSLPHVKTAFQAS